MQEHEKLATVLGKLNKTQMRMLTRVAEVLVEENRADPLHDDGDVRARYAQFKRWCDAHQLDPHSVESWIEESRQQVAAWATV